MKGVWFAVCAVALAVAGVVTVAPSIAQAAGLSRAQVLAEITGHWQAGSSPVQSASVVKSTAL
jgi:hypothetical protein